MGLAMIIPLFFVVFQSEIVRVRGRGRRKRLHRPSQPLPPLHDAGHGYCRGGGCGEDGWGRLRRPRSPNAAHNIPEESRCNEDKHKAPTSAPRHPLSLQDGWDASVPMNTTPLFGCQISTGMACTFVQTRTGLLTEVYARFFSYNSDKTHNNTCL